MVLQEHESCCRGCGSCEGEKECGSEIFSGLFDVGAMDPFSKTKKRVAQAERWWGQTGPGRMPRSEPTVISEVLSS